MVYRQIMERGFHPKREASSSTTPPTCYGNPVFKHRLNPARPVVELVVEVHRRAARGRLALSSPNANSPKVMTVLRGIIIADTKLEFPASSRRSS